MGLRAAARYPPPKNAQPAHQARSLPREKTPPSTAIPTMARVSRSIIPAHRSSAFLRAASPTAETTMRAMRVRIETCRMAPSRLPRNLRRGPLPDRQPSVEEHQAVQRHGEDQGRDAPDD